MKKLITRNNIIFAVGILLLIIGEFFEKQEFYKDYGVTIDSNLVQITGAILLLLPFLFKAIEAYKGKKID